MTPRRPRSSVGREVLRGLVASAVLAVLFLLLTSRAQPAETPGLPRITRGDFRSVLVLTGSLTALRSEEFKVPVTPAYRIQIKWLAREGDPVKPGDPVVRFDTANLAAELETAQESLRTKREEKVQKEADFRHQRFELEVAVKKAENDLERKAIDASIPPGIESRYEYDRKQLEKRKGGHALAGAETDKLVKLVETENQIRTLGIEVGELETKLAKLRTSLEELTLTAHTAGAVIYSVDDWSGRKVQVGDTVFATSAVATIPDLTSLRVQAWISETHVQRIRAGQAADLCLDAYPDKRFRGVIREISASAESIRRWGKSNYFRADIDVDRLDPEIMKPGMSVRCDILGAAAKDVLLIPLELTFFDGRTFWVRPDGGEAVSVVPLGLDEFVLAASPERNPRLKPGQALRPAAGPPPAREAGTDDRKAAN